MVECLVDIDELAEAAEDLVGICIDAGSNDEREAVPMSSMVGVRQIR